jgi:hypothetical protein
MTMLPDWLQTVRQAEQLFDQNKFAEAIELAQRALLGNPQSEQAYQVLGMAAFRQGRLLDAIPHLVRATTLRPDLIPSQNGLGQCYFQFGELDRALYYFDKTLLLDPAHSFAHLNRALVWLKQGRWHDGWVEYEWRWLTGLIPRPQIPRPRWDGSPLAGRAILVHSEQGMGDVFQFLRFIPVLKQQGGRVVLLCQKALLPLLRSLPYVDDWFPVDEPGQINFDIYCPLLSLPGLLDVNEATIPRNVPYLFLDPRRVERWREPVRSLPGFKVGICWQGSPTFQGDLFRSIPLHQFAPLSRIPGVTLVSLQKGPGVEQIAQCREQVRLHVFDNLDTEGAFLDTSAIIQHLDLVLSADSAITHLTGAMGRPAWVLLGGGCDWRWLEERSDSPWYPTVRVVRQKSFNDWPGLFKEVAAMIQAEMAGIAQRPGLVVQVSLSAGELLDKIAALEAQRGRTQDAGELARLRHELASLQAIRAESVPDSPALAELTTSLRHVHEEIGPLEEALRQGEREGAAGERLVEQARSLARHNERRAALLRQINELFAPAQAR